MAITEYDPWTEAEEEGLSPGDLAEVVRVLRWEVWMWVGPIRSRLNIRTWHRTKGNQSSYMACLCDGSDQDYRFVRTESLPEFMDLLARWSPIIQAEAVSNFIDDLRREDDDSGYDPVSLIAGKVLKKWQAYT